MIIPAHNVHLGDLGETSYFFTPPADGGSVLPSVISAGGNVLSYGWTAFSVALILWALFRGPAAQERKAAIKTADEGVKKARAKAKAARKRSRLRIG